MTARRALVLFVLAYATCASARTPLPPYDFTGHWSGTITAGVQVLTADADLAATGARTFAGTAVVNDVSCTLRGSRKRKVIVRVVCADGTKARLAGILDLEHDALAGVARLRKRNRHTAATFAIARAVASAPVCGDATVETGEECDDGNTVAGDGCSPTCIVETSAMTTVDEVEPNGVSVSANVVPSLPALVRGAVSPGPDQDFFAITISGSDLLLETFDAGGPGSCAAGTDTVIELRGPDGQTIVAIDDDGGVGTCSRLELHGLAPGLYYPCVRSATLTTIPAYQLRIVVP